jgi:hypothetical protein
MDGEGAVSLSIERTHISPKSLKEGTYQRTLKSQLPAFLNPIKTRVQYLANNLSV